MSKESAIIKFAFVNHKEYQNKKAGNEKHSAVCEFCSNQHTISDGKGTTSAFTRHMQRFHKAK